LASLTTVRDFSISAGLDASTETPGRTPPDVSRTEPAIAVVSAWAKAGRGQNANQMKALTTHV
jgi:hypothetical protein